MTPFSRKPIDLTQLRPTSKMSLKLTCLSACNNDVRAASELYDFIAGDLNLPDLEPERVSTFQQIKQGADDVFGWVQQHKEDLMQGYQMIRGLGKSAEPIKNVPPIPKQ